MSSMDHQRGKHERKESSSKLTALVVSALAPLAIDQVTSRRERGVTECILSGHAGVNMKLLVTASDVSKGLVLWRLLLEYISLIILRRFYGKLCACANNVYRAVFFGLGTRLWANVTGSMTSFNNSWQSDGSVCCLLLFLKRGKADGSVCWFLSLFLYTFDEAKKRKLDSQTC